MRGPWKLFLLIDSIAAQATWNVAKPVLKVMRLTQWQPAPAKESERRPIVSLTAAVAVREAGSKKLTPLAAPAFAVNVGVGHPQQNLTLALDTTSGTSWLLELGVQKYKGELHGISLYSPLGSSTAQYIEAAELRPRVQVSLAPVIPHEALVGRVVEDNVQLAGAVVPRQPLVLAERVPSSVLSWTVAGVLGLGIQSSVTAPLIDSWKNGWIAGPTGISASPTQLALRDTSFLDSAGTHRLPPPVLSIWPEAAMVSRTAPMWLGLGEIPGTMWVPLSSTSAAWATDGYVSVAIDQGHQEHQRWAARLLVDTTTPCMGVPARHMARLVHTMLPSIAVDLCWWHATETFGLQIQCECSIVGHIHAMNFEIAGHWLSLTANNLFIADDSGRVCTAMLEPLSEPGNIWRLGAPFLHQYGVTLDSPRQRLGFAPPPIPDLSTVIQDIHGTIGLGDATSTAFHLPVSNAIIFSPLAALPLLAIASLLLLAHLASGHRLPSPRAWSTVQVELPHASDEEDTAFLLASTPEEYDSEPAVSGAL